MVETSGISKTDCFLGVLRKRTRLGDIALLLSVPLVLVWVFSLPLATRESLVFAYTDPTLLTAYTSAFVHLDSMHLLVNVGGYLLVAPLAYVLSALGGHRRRFFVAFAVFLVVFPVALSYLNLAFVRPSVGYGFSGVLLAFVGYLPIALADYVEAQFDVDVRANRSLAPALFFVGLALAAMLSVRSLVTAGLAVAALLSALLYALPAFDGRTRLRSNVRAAAGMTGHFELFTVAVVAFVAFPFVAFPADSAGDGTVVNLYVHLLGYALAFVATYVTIEVGVRLPGGEAWV
ncbi:hypothetical protein [Natronomonas sp.]|uniref:hypothetical protein n=1 Tax=Natronomonas sp. TaxID=2184060 RepID=UPI002FC2E67F